MRIWIPTSHLLKERGWFPYTQVISVFRLPTARSPCRGRASHLDAQLGAAGLSSAAFSFGAVPRNPVGGSRLFQLGARRKRKLCPPSVVLPSYSVIFPTNPLLHQSPLSSFSTTPRTLCALLYPLRPKKGHLTPLTGRSTFSEVGCGVSSWREVLGSEEAGSAGHISAPGSEEHPGRLWASGQSLSTFWGMT